MLFSAAEASTEGSARRLEVPAPGRAAALQGRHCPAHQDLCAQLWWESKPNAAEKSCHKFWRKKVNVQIGKQSNRASNSQKFINDQQTDRQWWKRKRNATFSSQAEEDHRAQAAAVENARPAHLCRHTKMQMPSHKADSLLGTYFIKT